jgi:uroporphyrinogen-III synthase
MQENKIEILCTSHLKDDLLTKAAAKNILIDVQSFIKTETSLSEESKQKIQNLSKKRIAVVFTSKNAVNAVVSQLSTVPNWDVFCISGKTKQTTLEFFSNKKNIVSAKNAAGLAEKIIADKTIQEVVFFCGNQRLNDLPEILKQNNISVKELIVYHTEETPHIIQKDYDAILFFSPSAVHSFFSVNTISTNVLLFSIGKTTSTTIATYCSNLVNTSEYPGKEQMINLVTDFFSTFITQK